MRKKTSTKQHEQEHSDIEQQIRKEFPEDYCPNKTSFPKWAKFAGFLGFLLIIGTVIAVAFALRENSNGQGGVPPRARRERKLVKIEMQIGEKKRIVPLLSTDKRGIPTNLSQEDLDSMDPQMQIPILGGEGTEVSLLPEGHDRWIEGVDVYHIDCPYQCGKWFEPKKNELNCHAHGLENLKLHVRLDLLFSGF